MDFYRTRQRSRIYHLATGITVLATAVMACSLLAPKRTSPSVENTKTPAAAVPTTTANPLPQAEPTNGLSQPTQPSAPGQVVGAAGERSIGDPYAPELGNTGYDVQFYTLRLAVDPAQVFITAHVTVEALSTLADLGQISLDFIGYDIDQVSLNGSPVNYSREDAKLIVDFPEPLDEGEAFTLDVVYSGAPVVEASEYLPFVDHLGLFFNTETRRAFALSEPDGSRYWFPCNDHPRDKAKFRFELTVPEGLVGVANGNLLETHTEVPNALPSGEAGDQYIWEHDYPMATYLATIAVGDYVRVDGKSPAGIPLRSYVFPDQQRSYEELQPQVGEMLDWMSEHFGPYPFEAFGYVSIEAVGASLETQTMVALGALDPYVMAHEMAHMWFGDWVSLDSWGDMWRNEGFATYVGTWAMNGTPPPTSNWEQMINDSPNDFPLNDPPTGELFGRDSYIKGALLVDALRDEMGAEAFLKGLQLYFERYGGGVATHEQFQAALEEAYGQSLSPVFEEWFQGQPVQ